MEQHRGIKSARPLHRSQQGTGEQNVLELRRLKRPIVRGMHDQLRPRKVARHSEPWTQSVLIDQRLRVVPTQGRADGPFVQADQVLNKCGRFEVRTIACEPESGRRVLVEQRKVGDRIVEAPMEGIFVGLNSRLPLLRP